MQNRNSNGGNANAAFVLSMIIFGTIGIFRRYIPLPSGLIAFSRGLIGMLFLLVLVAVRGIRLSGENIRSNAWRLLLSGIFLGFNWILLFEAYRYTSVAIATLCYYMAPILVVLVSPLLFGESLGIRKILCVLIALAGMVLVSGVADSGLAEGENLKGILLGLGAAVLYASVVLMNKTIAGVTSYEKTIVQLGTAAAVILPYTLLTESVSLQAFSPRAILCLLLVGIVHTGIAYALYFGAVSNMKAQTAALFSYLDPVVAILLSAVLLNEPMTVLVCVGAVMVLGAALMCEVEPGRKQKESIKEQEKRS